MCCVSQAMGAQPETQSRIRFLAAQGAGHWQGHWHGLVTMKSLGLLLVAQFPSQKDHIKPFIQLADCTYRTVCLDLGAQQQRKVVARLL